MNKNTKKPRIGITLGDPNGIGPEIVIKTLMDSNITRCVTPVIYGSKHILSFYEKKIPQYIRKIKNQKETPRLADMLVECDEYFTNITPKKPSQEAANVALTFLRRAFQDTRNGILDGLVTNPLNKSLIYSQNFPYRGHTEYLAHACGVDDRMMMMVAGKVRVGLVTEHVALTEVANMITHERIVSKINLMKKSLFEDFEIEHPKIAVLGLNPHAGDGGLLGREESHIIDPIIKNNDYVEGPFAADGFFASKHYIQYDGILAMYHDQGLIPFKTLFFDAGTNYTAGLPIIRTSPDHGPAYSIAGTGVANEGSLKASIYLTRDLIIRKQRRKK